MKAFGGFLLTLLVIVVIVGVVGVISYTHEMAPTWAEIAKQQADLDIAIAKQNVQADIATHSAVSMAISAGSWVLVLLLLAGGVVWFVWKPLDERKESWARPVDGQHAIQTFSNGRITWKVDIDKSFPGNAGFDHSTGMLGDLSSGAQESNQLTYNLAVQKTRTVTAASSQPIKYAAHAKMLAGGYDREPRQIAQTPADPDGEAITEPVELLTLKQAVERSTPEAWIIGQNQETGKLAYFKPNEAIHLAILGATGTGKTSSTGMQIVGYALKNGWRVSILDGKGRGDDWSKFSRWCEHTWIDSENFADALKPIKAEYDRRSELLRFENPPKLQPLLVMIEEYGDINEGLIGKAKEMVNSILDTLVRKARDTEIHLCFIDQYPEKWEKQLLNNTKNKVVYWLNDGTLVKEHFVHQLALSGEFYLKGERYNSWHVKPMVKAFLSDVPMLDAKSVHDSVRDSVHGDMFAPVRQEVDPLPPDSMNSDKGKWYDWSVDYMSKHVELWQTPPTGIREMARQMSMQETGSTDNANRYTGIASSMCKRIRQDAGIGTDVSM